MSSTFCTLVLTELVDQLCCHDGTKQMAKDVRDLLKKNASFAIMRCYTQCCMYPFWVCVCVCVHCSSCVEMFTIVHEPHTLSMKLEGCCMVVHQSAVSNVFTMEKLPAHQQEGKCKQQHVIQ